MVRVNIQIKNRSFQNNYIQWNILISMFINWSWLIEMGLDDIKYLLYTLLSWR